MPQRTLSESEFNTIKAKVLDSLPTGLSEADFNRIAPTKLAQAIGEAESLPVQPDGSSVGRFVSNAASMLNPVAAVEGLYNAVRHPIDTATTIGADMLAQGQQGVEGLRNARGLGDVVEATGHLGAAALPIVGPAAARAGQQIASGDVAGGLGAGAGLLAPMGIAPAIRGARAVLSPAAREAAAAGLERGAAARVADVIAPKVGANKVRFGNMAEQVAPSLAKAPDGAAWSREGLHGQVAARLEQAEAALDEAANNRLSTRTFPTQPIIDDLLEKRRKLTAEPVEASRVVPSITEGAARGTPIDPMQTYALRWMKDEMESFPFTKHTFNEVPRGSGGDLDIVPGSGGAEIYRAIVGDEGAQVSRATRGQVSQAITDVMQGKTTSRLQQLVVGVADDLAKGGPTQKLMRTPGPLVRDADFDTTRWRDLAGKGTVPALTKEGRPLGAPVVPAPNQQQVAMIDQAIADLKQLGPVTKYEPLRRLRQAYDQPAKARYSPTLTQDFLKVQGEAKGAADVTGVLRDRLAQFDPETVKANAEYSLYRKADDVLSATAEVERTRPKVGRQIMARLTGSVIGERAAGIPGAVGGFLLGPALDAAVSSGVTTKLQTAKMMTRLADAIRKGDVGHVNSLSYELKKLAAQGAAVQATSPSGAPAQPAGVGP